MPFLFHKLLPLGVLPIGFVLLMLILAFFFRKRWMMAAGAIALYLASIDAVSEPLIRTLEDRYPRLNAASCPPADAIVVLGGILRERTDGVEWSEGTDRFEQGVALFKAGKAPSIVFTGARLPWYSRQQTEGDDLKRVAIERGVPETAVLVTSQVAVTAQESDAVRELAKRNNWNSIILVTSAFHMPRSVGLFRNVASRITPFPTDYRSRTGVRTSVMDFVPQAQPLLTTDAAVKEYWGMLYYAIRR